MTPPDASTARPGGLRRLALRGITPLAIVVGVGVLGSGSAYAYWTIGGHGTSSATTGTALHALTATATAPAGDLLVPGGNSPLSLRLTNSGPLSVTVTDVTAAGAITSDKPGCAGSNVTFTPGTNLSIVAPAGSSVTTAIAHLVNMSSPAANACQGATFTIPVTLSGRTS